jgi:twinkle protein
MGKAVGPKRACLDEEGCGSSDALQMYDDGTFFCWSCRKWFPPIGEVHVDEKQEYKPKVKLTVEDIKKLPQRGFKERQISKDVAEFFGVHVSYDEDGNIDAHYYPYGDNAYKIRKLPKDFFWIGKSKDLFGRDKFSGGGKRLVITEGEIDAMSYAYASSKSKYQKIFPVVSVPSATMLEGLLEHREWIRSFDEVILSFDQDKVGEEAKMKAIRIIGLDKVKLTKFPNNRKDANDVLLKDGWAALQDCMFRAERYIPSGIITKDELWESLKNHANIPALPYPPCLDGLNTKLKGMRKGEIGIYVSGTGAGKSTLIREIDLHVLNVTDEKIGIMSLEESPQETAMKLSGMHLNRNPQDEEIPIDELKVGFDAVFGDERVVLLDHQGSFSDTSMLDKLEYMCLSGCTYIFIDHITILVSEGIESLRGNEAQDKMMSDLLKLVKKHPVFLGVVAHLRKTSGRDGAKSFEEGQIPGLDDIKGSGSIKQIGFDIVAFARNMTADDEVERNTIKMRVLKARTVGKTGNVPGAFYDYKTGRLRYDDRKITKTTRVDKNHKEDFTSIEDPA